MINFTYLEKTLKKKYSRSLIFGIKFGESLGKEETNPSDILMENNSSHNFFSLCKICLDF